MNEKTTQEPFSYEITAEVERSERMINALLLEFGKDEASFMATIGVWLANNISERILNELTVEFGQDESLILATIDSMFIKINATILTANTGDDVSSAMERWNGTISYFSSVEGQVYMRSLMEKLVTPKEIQH